MEKKTMGSFMSALRKANGLTQQQVADKLNVSNKTVSKWECDEGYPEITMLPAIAEIYSVTVDELLRGEKITHQNSNASHHDTKTEKQIIYLFKSSENKYSTLSVIALALGCFALFLSLLFISNTIGIILTFLLTGSAVITEIIAYMNYKVLLEDPESVISESLKMKSKKKIRKFIVSIFAVSTATLAQMLIALTYGYFIPWFVLAVFIVMLASILLNRYLGKKFLIEENLSEEYILYKNKKIKSVSIFSLVAIVLSIILPFCIVFIEDKCEETAFSFVADSYITKSDNSAETDYYKLKNHILNGNDLYYFDYADETGIDVCKIEIKTTLDNDRLIITEIYEDDWEYKEFTDKAERDSFIEEYVINESVYRFLYSSYENCESLTFDDEALTLNTKNTGVDLTSAFDILPVFILIGVISSSSAIIAGFILCYRKKDN